MKNSKLHRLLLIVSGLLAIGIGAAILTDPAAFHSNNGIALGADANLLSEVRAPGGALLVLGCMILCGGFVKSLERTSTSIGAAVYLSYGSSRLLSLVLDGLPALGLLGATAIELLLGFACLLALSRSRQR